mmetsp:Transcript_29422/g.46728  ORF Transcript_29422/g.46728 Transcript_29422/m.46728 type:complete len:475 (+) Transcript_29422:46-1470(+)
MAACSPTEQLNERREKMKRRNRNNRNHNEEANHAPDEEEEDQDIKMESDSHSNTHSHAKEEEDIVESIMPEIDLVSEDENDEISYQPQIDSLLQKIKAQQGKVRRQLTKYEKEAQELVKLQQELKRVREQQHNQLNNARIQSESNGHHNHHHRKHRTPNHSHSHHRHHHNHSHSPSNQTKNTQATPQLIKDERQRRSKQEEHDREVALRLQREFDRAEQQRGDPNNREQDVRFIQPPQQQPRNRNRHSTRNRNGVRHPHGNAFDEADDEFSPFSVFENDPFFAQHQQHHNHNSNSDRAMGFHRNPFAALHSSPFAFSASFDQAPFEEMRRFHINALNRPMVMFNGMPADIDNMSFEQLNSLFPNMPRGANEESIQRLPTDTFRRKDERKNQSENDAVINGNSNSSNVNGSNQRKKNKKESNDDANKCCICLEQFENGDEIRRLPCLHIFHKEEIDKWLRSNRVCPICRVNIEEH